MSDNLIKWRRGDWKQLTTNFNTKEFECKCGQCVEQQIDMRLVRKLQAIRDRLQRSLIITSAFRCRAYQAYLRGKGIQTAQGISQHELGCAADIRLVDGLDAIVWLFFSAVGAARTFLHVDLRDDKKRSWIYA